MMARRKKSTVDGGKRKKPKLQEPLPSDALNEVLAFLPFTTLQAKALINRQVAPLVIGQAEEVIGRAGSSSYSESFVNKRSLVMNVMHNRRIRAAKSRHAAVVRDIEEVKRACFTLMRQASANSQWAGVYVQRHKEEMRRWGQLIEESKELIATMEEEFRLKKASSRWAERETRRIGRRLGWRK